MIDLNYYSPLATVNESEQKNLSKMHNAFNAAIGKADAAQDSMIADYMGAKESRRLCRLECSKGWSTDTKSWLSNIKTDAMPTTDTSSQGLLEVTNSCKAGCDLKWQVPNTAGVVKDTGLYTSAAGKEHEITHCDDLAQYAPPTNCVVSDYSWSSCSADCGPGTQTGTRTITTAPQNGGTPCPVLSETRDCLTKPCPVDCVVSDYSDWGSCSADCGPGTKTATRTVITPAQYGGKACPVLSKSTNCQDKPCPIDCEVSEFSEWSSCSKNCGPGTETSTRTVTTAPQNGGQACPALSQSRSCNNGACTSVRISTDSFGGGAPVVDDYLCKNTPDGDGTFYNTAQSKAYETSSDCGAHDQCMIEVTEDCKVQSHMQDRCKSARNWDDWSNMVEGVGATASNHGCSSTIISESFVGGRKEGFTPLQGDFVKACKDAGTRGGKQIPGTTKPGYSFVEDRKQEIESFNKLKSIQQQLKKSINQMQSKNLGTNSSYKTQNINLLKKLSSYEVPQYDNFGSFFFHFYQYIRSGQSRSESFF